jgi:multidrug efflux pump subunit AcrB
VLTIVVLGGLLGTEIFPQSDEGQLTLRFRAEEGLRIEETEKVALRVLDVIKQEAGPGNVESTMGYVGAQSCDHPINAIYLWTSGPNEGVLQIQLRHGSGIRVEEFKERLRRSFAAKLPGGGLLVRAQRHRQPRAQLRGVDAGRSLGQRPQSGPEP